ncbi:MAG: cupin domain-containing protein [Dehalococcoidia bacterium]
MEVRRVVTGKNAEGKSVFVSDAKVPPIVPLLTPGAEFHTIWGSDVVTQLPQDGTLPPFTQWFPPPGGYRVGFFSVAPANAPAPQVTDMQAAFADLESKLPGLAGHMEPDTPGMHTTQTIDIEYVISGEVWLELDDGAEVRLGPGDTVVQNGTRHAWRNKGDVPCVMMLVLIGAKA